MPNMTQAIKKQILMHLKNEFRNLKFRASTTGTSITVKVCDDALFNAQLEWDLKGTDDLLKWGEDYYRKAIATIKASKERQLTSFVCETPYGNMLESIEKVIKKAGNHKEESDILEDYYRTNFFFYVNVCASK